ncbi:MAG: hypothetical protein JRF50_16785 [Deltaproteobacteria bacterium]|nr:hypothetical protein [Deltaproteobacteria bacterium]
MITQKEYQDIQKEKDSLKPTGYTPDHLQPPHKRKRPHGTFADFERAMDSHIVNIIGQGKEIQIVGEGYQDRFRETVNMKEDNRH